MAFFIFFFFPPFYTKHAQQQYLWAYIRIYIYIVLYIHVVLSRRARARGYFSEDNAENNNNRVRPFWVGAPPPPVISRTPKITRSAGTARTRRPARDLFFFYIYSSRVDGRRADNLARARQVQRSPPSSAGLEGTAGARRR